MKHRHICRRAISPMQYIVSGNGTELRQGRPSGSDLADTSGAIAHPALRLTDAYMKIEAYGTPEALAALERLKRSLSR